jgi:exosortase A
VQSNTANPESVLSRWASALGLLALVLAALIAVFYGTAESIVAIWLRSDTFAHGFLIVPISLWLIWEKRAGLAQLAPQPAYVPALLMVPMGFGWLLGYLVDVLVVQQFAFVGVLILAIWSVMGTPVTRYLAFPILFLFFGVPVGEGLIYPMMNFTADFTVGMLRLTGIPVFRDGTFFSIPSGDWSVVEACSGVRYLIASVTLGVLYAYLTYSRLWKRLLFVAVSIVVPVFANGLRAYMIVMLAHLSDMKLAVGIDHLIYGWVFFGIIITIMFFIGSFWRDPDVAHLPRMLSNKRSGPGAAVAAAVAAVAVAAVWPALAWSLRAEMPATGAAVVAAPAAGAGWKATDREAWDWRPHIVGADGERYDFYTDDGGTPVGLYLGAYLSQRQDAELLSSQNQMVVQKHPVWSDKEQTTRQITIAGQPYQVNQSRLASQTGRRLLVWSWYRIGDRYTGNPYVGKLFEAATLLFHGRRDGSMIVVAAPYTEHEEKAAEALQGFIDAMLPSIEKTLEEATKGAS